MLIHLKKNNRIEFLADFWTKMYLSDTQNKQNVPFILIRDIEHNSFQFSTIALYTDQIKKHSYHKTDQAFFLSKNFYLLKNLEL